MTHNSISKVIIMLSEMSLFDLDTGLLEITQIIRFMKHMEQEH